MINLNFALIERRPEWEPPHKAKPLKEALKTFGWNKLSHPQNSPVLATSDHQLFALMGHALAEKLQNGSINSIALRANNFSGMVSIN